MRKLNKKHITEVYKKCLNLIRRKPPGFVVFKKLRYYGWCKADEDILEVDHRKDMLRTAYHECIHYLYPDWSETMVLYAESRVVNNCTILDNVRFLKHLSDKVYKAVLKQSRIKKAKKNAPRNR
jgi:hypothetical protein